MVDNFGVYNNNNNKENGFIKPVRTKLYVSNFPSNSTRRSLTEFFSKFGQVLECAIMWDKYAFIHYGTMEEAQNALRKASGMYFMGKKLFIQLSTSRNRQSCNWYQQEAEKLLTKTQTNLNDTSFMSSSSSSNLVETKLYVTNLPDNCSQQELKELFEKYGQVLECVIMWNHYAFIHFADFTEAKIALDNLHGTIFNGKTLIVQLSTSSNRPLPKCLAFSSNKFNTSLNDSFKENTKSSIVCYKASEENNSSKEKDWIEIIKNGCLPVIKQKSIDETEVKKQESNRIDLIKLLGLETKKVVEEKEKLTFDQIPTPPLPESLLFTQREDSKKEQEETKNEKILIDRLNLLKYENNFEENRLKNLWSNSVEELSSQIITNSSSSGVSTSSSVRSLSPQYNCVLEQIDRHIFESKTTTTTTTQTTFKKSRCKLVNYLLFPEVKEENFLNKREYDSILIDLIKKNCIID